MKLPEFSGYCKGKSFSEGEKHCVLWQDQTVRGDALRETARKLCCAEIARRQEICGKRNDFGKKVKKNSVLCER